jgi:hypothetical protein
MELIDDSNVLLPLRQLELAESEVFVSGLFDVRQAEATFWEFLHFPGIGPVVSALALPIGITHC